MTDFPPDLQLRLKMRGGASLELDQPFDQFEFEPKKREWLLEFVNLLLDQAERELAVRDLTRALRAIANRKKGVEERPSSAKPTGRPAS